jgi:O-antigen ligase
MEQTNKLDYPIAIGRERWAYRIILVISAAALYIDMDLFSISGVVISIHKLIALVGFPAAIALMSWSKIHIDARIVLFGILMGITFSLFYLLTLTFDERFFSGILQVGISGAAAVLIFSALANDQNAFRFFMVTLIIFAAVSSFITIIQFMKNISNTSSFSAGLAASTSFRVSGLLLDPNYQSAALLLGAAALFSLTKTILIVPIFLLLSLGILCTFSRMGLITLVILILLSPLFLPRPNKKFKWHSWSLWIIYSLAATVLLLHPEGLGKILLKRFAVVFEIINNIIPSKGASLLQDARIKLFYNGFLGFIEYPLSGIGIFNSNDFMAASMGRPIALHNTYMEFILSGGIWGILLLVFLYGSFISAVKNGPIESLTRLNHHFLILFGIIYSIVSVFLSYHLDITTWLLLVLSLHYRDRVSDKAPNIRWRKLRE